MGRYNDHDVLTIMFIQSCEYLSMPACAMKVPKLQESFQSIGGPIMCTSTEKQSKDSMHVILIVHCL